MLTQSMIKSKESALLQKHINSLAIAVLSFLLVSAMIISFFIPVFLTTAAADEFDVPEVTYYLLAPDDTTTPNAYWWIPEQPSDWPGLEMTAAPKVGKQVYKVSATAETTVIIFNGAFGQTVNLAIDKDSLNDGLTNVSNMIFVVTGKEQIGKRDESGNIVKDKEGNAVMVDGHSFVGEWMSLHPYSDNYYRNSSAYKSLGISDTTATEVPEYDPNIECRTYPTKITPANMKLTTFKFKASGDFANYNKMYFYIWDDTNKAQLDKNGQWWLNCNLWGSKAIRVSAIDGNANEYEYSVPIPKGHNVYLIVQAYISAVQTCNIILTEAANGDTLYITGDLLENPIDPTQKMIEAKFENTEECGPAKVVTSTCKVQGTVLQSDPAEMFARALAAYYTDTTNWTRENVKAAEAALGVTDDEVKIALNSVEGRSAEQISAASVLLEDKELSSDTDKSKSTDTSKDTDKSKSTDTSKDTDKSKSSDTNKDTDKPKSSDTSTDTDKSKSTDNENTSVSTDKDTSTDKQTAVSTDKDTSTDKQTAVSTDTDTQKPSATDTDKQKSTDTEKNSDSTDKEVSSDDNNTVSSDATKEADTDNNKPSDTSTDKQPTSTDSEKSSDTPTQAAPCANGHKYVLDSFEWGSADETAKAKFVCENNSEHTTDVDCKITKKLTKEPTCEENGTEELTATAKLDGKTYSDTKTKTALKKGHDYEATWNWPQNFDNTVKVDDVTVTLTCKNDPTHTQTLKAIVKEVIRSEDENGSVIDYYATAASDGNKYTDSVVVTAVKPIMDGDVDGDEDLTSNDALIILRASLAMIELATERQQKAADFDHDGAITSNDAINVLRDSTLKAR